MSFTAYCKVCQKAMALHSVEDTEVCFKQSQMLFWKKDE